MTEITENESNIEKKYDYDVFGNEISHDNSDTNPFRYCGEYYDGETESIYLRARYYNTSTGRFISEGPIKDGLNWYAYCGGNPVMFLDPNGLEEIVVSGGDYSALPNKYDYTFIDPAIKNLRALKEKNPEENLTWIIADAGWTEVEKAKFILVANDIGCNIIFIDDVDELIGYINYKDENKSRYKDKITVFNVFSHGILGDDGRGVISLGYNYLLYNKNLNLTAEDITNRIYATAFDNPSCWFGSCNLGNNTTDSFAQTWVNKFGRRTWAFNGKSYYGEINFNQTLEEKVLRKLYGFTYGGSTSYPIPGDGATFHEFYNQMGA